MPSKSVKQHNLMEAVAHDPGFAARAHIPQSVGQDFAKADKSDKSYKKRQRIGKIIKHMSK